VVVIAFEGKSDAEFLDSLFEEYNLPRNEVIYYEFKGKDNIFNTSHNFYDEIEEDIQKIDKMLIIVDADNENDPNPNRGYKASEQKPKEIIDTLDFDIPIDYQIMCGKNKEGHLESFLLSVLDDEQQECINKFKECYKYELTDKWAYNTFYKQKKYPFNYGHPYFKDLKQKLTNLFKKEE